MTSSTELRAAPVGPNVLGSKVILLPKPGPIEPHRAQSAPTLITVNKPEMRGNSAI
jgi:hypothetical protein